LYKIFSMTIQSITLRKNPSFKIILNDENFEILNEADKDDNGFYFYKHIDSLELKHKGINWFVTLLDVIVHFFLIVVLIIF